MCFRVVIPLYAFALSNYHNILFCVLSYDDLSKKGGNSIGTLVGQSLVFRVLGLGFRVWGLGFSEALP